MRCVLLGLPTLDRSWKVDLAHAGQRLGWDVTHLPAKGITVPDVVDTCRDADLMIWARTPGHTPLGDTAGMLRRVEDTGTATAGVHLDLYWGIPHREREIGRHPWWTCQHVFTADGGPRPWRERGVTHHWLTPPLGRRYLGRRPLSGRYPHPVVFVGSYNPIAHGPHRQQLITWARRRYGATFARYGGTSRKIRGHDLGDLYSSARVVLGDSAPAEYYWSDRVPCTLGRGGLLSHPHTKGLAEQGYGPDVMLLYDRGNFDELGERIDSLTEANQVELTDAAISLVADCHLWEHRLVDIARTTGLI